MAKRMYRRRRGRKGKRSFAKRVLRRAHKDGKNIFKLSGVVSLDSNSITGVMTHTVSTTNPGAYYDGASALPDLSNLTALYDQGRICAIKLRFIPNYPNDLASFANYKPVYIVRDDDDASLASSISEMVQYENFKVKNLFMPWKYYTKCPRVVGAAAGTAFVNVGSMGWFDLAAAQSLGAIKIYADGLNTASNNTYGQLVITYYIAFKSRR